MEPGGESAVERLLAAFAERIGDPQRAVVARAPGRVNLIGDHTDYNDGFVLPMTLDMATCLALRPRSDDRISLYSVDRDEHVELEIAAAGDSSGGWWRYVAGAAVVLRELGHPVGGFEGTLHGTVPVGAGLSSSASLVMAALATLEALFEFELDGSAAARMAQQVEHRFASVRCGIMDPFVARLGRPNHALLLDCRSLDYAHVPLDPGQATIVVVDSRTPRALAGSKYNERRAECERGVAILREVDPSVTALRDVSHALLEAHVERLPDPVGRRCRHVVEENQRVLDAVQALQTGDYAGLGRLMDESHASLRDLYEVSSPELNLIVEAAREVEGVLGARMTGAGFGGCAVVLVEPGALPDLARRVGIRYARAFGMAPAVYPAGPGTRQAR